MRQCLNTYFHRFFSYITRRLRCFCIDRQNNELALTRVGYRFQFILHVLNQNKELVIGPAITLVPQLFSVPLFLATFILNCQHLETSPVRYLLMFSYLVSFVPQSISFLLYISTSSFYSKEWHNTRMCLWMNRLFRWHAPLTTRGPTILSGARENTKDRDESVVRVRVKVTKDHHGHLHSHPQENIQ